MIKVIFLKVRLMYERVPRNRAPLLQHLDDPVVRICAPATMVCWR